MKKTYQKPSLTETHLLQGFQLCAASGVVNEDLGDDENLVEQEAEVLSKQYSVDLWEEEE